MSLGGGKVGPRFHLFNNKVADITHADTNKHEITLATMGLPLNVVAMIIVATRQGGTGGLNVYPNEGVYNLQGTYTSNCMVVGIINQRLQYALSVSGDDFDLVCFGYWTR